MLGRILDSEISCSRAGVNVMFRAASRFAAAVVVVVVETWGMGGGLKYILSSN